MYDPSFFASNHNIYHYSFIKRLTLNADGHYYKKRIRIVCLVYFSTSISAVLSVLIGLQWLFSGRFMALPAVLKSCPVAAWALSLLGFFFIGLIYSSATLQEGLAMINKYRELFFIPVFMSFLGTERARYWLWNAFIFFFFFTLEGTFIMVSSFLELITPFYAFFNS